MITESNINNDGCGHGVCPAINLERLTSSMPCMSGAGDLSKIVEQIQSLCKIIPSITAMLPSIMTLMKMFTGGGGSSFIPTAPAPVAPMDEVVEIDDDEVEILKKIISIYKNNSKLPEVLEVIEKVEKYKDFMLRLVDQIQKIKGLEE